MMPVKCLRRTAGALLLITVAVLYCCSSVQAGKINAKTTTTTALTHTANAATNATIVELISATKKAATLANTMPGAATPTAIKTVAANTTATAKPNADETDDDDDDDDEGEEEEEENDDNDDDDDDDDSVTAAGTIAANVTQPLKPATKQKTTTTLAAAEKNGAASEAATSSFSIWGMVRSVWHWIRDDLSESLLGDDGSETATAVALTKSAKTLKGRTTAAATVEGRTFGKIRRLQMALIPLIFKFGMLTAMVAFLVMIGMKTLFLVKLLLLMNAAAILAKFITFKANFGGGYEHEQHYAPPAWSYANWSPHAQSGWSATAPAATHGSHPPSKEIHLHIHGGGGGAVGSGGAVGAHVQPQISSATYAYGVGSNNGGHGWESRSDPYGVYEPAPSVTEIELENELNNAGPVALLPTKYPNNHRSYY